MAVALSEVYRHIPVAEPVHLYTRPLPDATPEGDFAMQDHATIVTLVNFAVERHVNEHRSQSERPFPPYAVEEGKRLIADITTARYEVGQKERTRDADELRAKYTLADTLSLDQSMEQRVAQRIQTVGMDEREYISDVDGTMTTEPDKYLEQLLPASSIGERILKEHGGNRKVFPYAFAMTWQHGLRSVPEAFRQAGKQAPLRHGVADFIEYAKAAGHTFKANSANFRQFVDGVFDQIPQAADYVQIHAVNADDITATDKGTYIKKDALENTNRPVFFFGDGSSDKAALEAREYVTCYFALEGSSFAKELSETKLASGESVPFFTYKTYSDILSKMQELDTLNAA